VLQVIILRDGLLVGTEVLMPGAYTLGSAAECELRLDDPSVAARHATLYFQNGKAAIQDAGSRSGLYVNGHRVGACQVRSTDEITCGPFVLKAKVLENRNAPSMPAEVASLLQLTPAHGAAAARPAPAPTPFASKPAQPMRPLTARPPVASHAAQLPTRVGPFPAPAAPATHKPAHSAPPVAMHRAAPAQNTVVSSRQLNGSAAAMKQHPVAAPRNVASPALFSPPRAAHSRPTRAARRRRTVEPLAGRGPQQLYVEVNWDEQRLSAKSFRLKKDKPLIAAESDAAPLPLYGFSLPPEGFTLAHAAGNDFRLCIPQGATVEHCTAGMPFEKMHLSQLEGEGEARTLLLTPGQAVRLTMGSMSLLAYVGQRPKQEFVNPLKGLPLMALFWLLLLSGGMGYFLAELPKQREGADFSPKSIAPVAVRLLPPPPKKKPEPPKKAEPIKEIKEEVAVQAPKEAEPVKRPKPKASKVARAEKAPPKAPPPETAALKALSKLTAAGPAMGDLLAAVDKLGNGPGSKNVKTSDYKLAGLIGKAPIANAGYGGFGLGGRGRGGISTQGAELLRGRGGGGIGAMGAGNVGQGKVGGTVAQAVGRMVSAQGSIDREAVARVVNSHLQEVRACYERALLKDTGLSGKLALEWVIGASGKVSSVKIKSSSLRNSAVESCIMNELKDWVFPSPRGGSVIVSYPFLFNSVGY
jgi:hypothetical protein